MTDKLRSAFDGAWKSAEYRSWSRGLLGKPDGAGGYTVAVADRPGHYYVRVSTEGVLTVTTARTNGRIPARANLPVKMRLEQGSGYVILDLDTSGYLDAATVNDAANVYGVPQHTHELDSGMSYMAEAQRLEPGLVRPAGGWDVTIEPFRYYYDGTWQTYAGDTVSLAGSKPVTTGKHRLVVVGVDPATNGATAVVGSDADYATTLNQESIDAISIGDIFPLAAVLMRSDDTAVTTQSKYIDARGWLNYQAALFDDTEGDPANIGTAADGTSDYASRRDHVHAITTAVIGAQIFSDGEGDPAPVGTAADGTSDYASRRDHVHAITTATVGAAIYSDAEGDPADVGTTADGTSDYAARRDHVHGLADASVANAKLANMAESTIKGRADGAGTGVPVDLTASQAAAIVGTAALDVDTSALGNVGTGEDTIASYTVPADTLASNGDSIWFEAFGTAANNSNSKTLKVYFGADEIIAATDTSWGLEWTLRGRIIRTGTGTQKAFVDFTTSSGIGAGSLGGAAGVNTGATEDETGTIVLAITAEAVSDNDFVCEGMIVGKTPA